MNTKTVYKAKNACNEAYIEYYEANKQLWKAVKDTYEGKYVLYKSDDGYAGVAHVIECRKDYGIRGKILWADGDVDNWVVVNIDEILEDYELCGYDKAVSIFPNIADIE